MSRSHLFITPALNTSNCKKTATQKKLQKYFYDAFRKDPKPVYETKITQDCVWCSIMSFTVTEYWLYGSSDLNNLDYNTLLVLKYMII